MAKSKLPKSVLGMKVPKALRKSKSVKMLLSDPVGREILGGALVAGATAAASALARHRAGGQQLENAGEAVVDATKTAADATKNAISDAASALAGSITGLVSRFQPEDGAKKRPKKGKKDSPAQSGKSKKRVAPEARSTH